MAAKRRSGNLRQTLLAPPPAAFDRSGCQMSDDLLAVACAALPLGHLPLLRHQPHGRYAAHPGLRLAAYNPPGLGHNLAAVTSDAPPPQEVIALAAAFFRDAEGPWHLVIVADQ